MKVIKEYQHGNPVFGISTWRDHAPACPKCREVDTEKSATFVLACAEGSPLLMEEMVKRQAPVVRQKAKQVRDWARHAGVFKMK